METWSDAGSHGHEARKVAKSLLEVFGSCVVDFCALHKHGVQVG